MLEKTFGFRKANTIYQERVGAYGIGFDHEQKIPVVMTPLLDGRTGCFLPGGGIEHNETHAACIIRECLEEAGLRVIPRELICKIDYYHFIEQTRTNIYGIGYFYTMEIKGVVSEPTEKDSVLTCLTLAEVKERLFFPHQIWAVEQAFQHHGR